MSTMAQAPVDLRSDTVTRPTPAMRRAMAEAEVGDDVYAEDPTVNRLQSRAAEIFGREAALYFPSGSMANLTAIKTWARPGMEVICEAQAHIYLYEMAGVAAIAGCMPNTVPAPNGTLTWDLIEPLIRPHIYYRAQTALIELENTHNMHGGTVYPTEIAEDICDRAHAVDLPVHLDGARIFNASVALGRGIADITRKFDSVMFCLSKGLGAPVGSMLVGSRDFIDKARVTRKLLGGGMRQAGVLAAAGLVALEETPKAAASRPRKCAPPCGRPCADRGHRARPEKSCHQHLDLRRSRHGPQRNGSLRGAGERKYPVRRHGPVLHSHGHPL